MAAYQRKVFIGAKVAIWQSSIRNQGSFSAISRLIIVAMLFLVEKYAKVFNLVYKAGTFYYDREDQLDITTWVFSSLAHLLSYRLSRNAAY